MPVVCLFLVFVESIRKILKKLKKNLVIFLPKCLFENFLKGLKNTNPTHNTTQATEVCEMCIMMPPYSAGHDLGPAGAVHEGQGQVPPDPLPRPLRVFPARHLPRGPGNPAHVPAVSHSQDDEDPQRK